MQIWQQLPYFLELELLSSTLLVKLKVYHQKKVKKLQSMYIKSIQIPVKHTESAAQAGWKHFNSINNP